MSERWLEHTDDVLRGAGLRTSAGRTAVIELLAREPCLLTAPQVAERLRDEVSTATVYRALDTLHAHGLVRRFDAADGPGRYERADPSGHHHHHVVYDDGSVEPFADDQLERELEQLAGRLGLRLTAHDVVLYAERG